MSDKQEYFIFEAIPSGDCECFCFAVDRDTFKQVTKMEPDETDLFADWFIKDKPHLQGKYRLYPTDLFPKENNWFEVRSWKT